MALRKKLYYDVAAFGEVTGNPDPTFPATMRVGVTDLPYASAAIRFVGDQSTVNFGVGAGAFGSDQQGADADRYGNVMDPTLFNGVDPANDASGQQSTREAISAWFQLALVSSLSGITSTRMIVDFISA